jgi:putative two-component system response regulator
MFDVTKAAILIVDDEQSNVDLLLLLLRRHGYANVRGTTCTADGLAILDGGGVDLLILDLHMPEMDGFAVLAALRERTGAEVLPVLVLTGDGSRAIRNRALSSGAKDFLTKPFDTDEALLRIKNLIITRFLYDALTRQNEVLEDRVRERTCELEQAQVEILSRLARVAEYYDEETADHTRRVATLSSRIARALGLSPEAATLIGTASLLHDVGKIAVPGEITRQSGPLTDAQRQAMMQHTVEGARMLSGSRFELLRQAEEIAMTHHERWDGSGYPYGLRGAAIPLAGRIVAAADVFDALISDRPYKEAWSRARALDELRRMSGKHLDPDVVAALELVVVEAGARPQDRPVGSDTDRPQRGGAVNSEASVSSLLRAASS